MSDPFDETVAQMQAQALEQARAALGETVVDHWQHPRGMGTMDKPDGYALFTGPCGDTMEFSLRVERGALREVRFRTDGCASSIASGSMTVEMATGRTLAEARALQPEQVLDALGGLPGENNHCPTLACLTLRKALDDEASTHAAPWKRLYRR